MRSTHGIFNVGFAKNVRGFWGYRTRSRFGRALPCLHVYAMRTAIRRNIPTSYGFVTIIEEAPIYVGIFGSRRVRHALDLLLCACGFRAYAILGQTREFSATMLLTTGQ